MLFGFEESAESDPVRSGDDQVDAVVPPQATPSRLPWLYVALGLVTGLLLAILASLLLRTDDAALTQADIDASINQAFDATAGAPTAAAAAYQQIAPSLIAIKATSDEYPSPNIGTGVVINEQGQIITSLHVVADASVIDLQFANGSVSRATIESTDPALDIAVLKATARTGVLTPAVMGNARTLQVGDEVFAVGNPLGLTASISAGIISGLNRDIPFPDAEDGATFEDLIQFDAAVNQGSSGGPLLNANGQVVGIVTALADPAGQGFFVGIGFAVPIDIAAQRAADGPSQ